MVSVPNPLAADGTVINHPAERTLTVKLAETRGYAALLWREGHRALVEAEQSGRHGTPLVWAHGPGGVRLPAVCRRVTGLCGFGSSVAIPFTESW